MANQPALEHKEVTHLCSECDYDIAVFLRHENLLVCKSCGAETVADERYAKPGVQRVGANHPWKTGSLLDANREYHRGKAQPMPPSKKRFEMRLRDETRLALNYLQGEYGWTFAEIVETAIHEKEASRRKEQHDPRSITAGHHEEAPA